MGLCPTLGHNTRTIQLSNLMMDLLLSLLQLEGLYSTLRVAVNDNDGDNNDDDDDIVTLRIFSLVTEKMAP